MGNNLIKDWFCEHTDHIGTLKQLKRPIPQFNNRRRIGLIKTGRVVMVNWVRILLWGQWGLCVVPFLVFHSPCLDFLYQSVSSFLLFVVLLTNWLLTFLIPWMVHHVALLFGTPLLRKNKQEKNSLSQPITKTCLATSATTAVQGVAYMLYGMSVGQIERTAFVDTQVGFGVFWFVRAIGQVIFMLVVADITSYAFHRLAHEEKWLYHYHKLHHETVNVEHGLYSLQYGGLVDFLLSNMCYFTGFFVFRTDVLTISFYGIISAIVTAFGHSGLELRIASSKFHSDHHRYPRFNYAEHFKFVDMLYGTVR